MIRALVLLGAATALLGSGCGSPCGPSRGTVATVVDGDTVKLESGETVRYLMVDTPEVTSGKNECWGAQAKDFNVTLVRGREIELTYDQQCTDHFDRLLAYVKVGGVEVNTTLVERGYACMLYIAPNGTPRVDEFTALEDQARADKKGLWGNCSPLPPCAQ